MNIISSMNINKYTPFSITSTTTEVVKISGAISAQDVKSPTQSKSGIKKIYKKKTK